MAFDAAFFDLYGTLLVYGDMERAWSDWLTALAGRLRRLGLDLDWERLGASCAGLFSRPEPAPDRDGLTVYERRLGELCGELGLVPTAADLRALADETAAAWQGQIPVDSEAEAVLAALHERMPVALVSNFDHPPHVHALLADTGLGRHLDAVVVSAEVGVKKPDPRIFARPLEQLGLDGATVAYVGDSPEDLAAATAGGLVPILVARSGGASWVEAADFGTRSPAARAGLGTEPARVVSRLGEVIPLILES